MSSLSGVAIAPPVVPVTDLLLTVAQKLLNLSLYFKHPAFASEQEWRVFRVETLRCFLAKNTASVF